MIRRIVGAILAVALGLWIVAPALAGPIQYLIQTSNGQVWGNGDAFAPTPPAGYTYCRLDAAGLNALATAKAGPNGGITTQATPDASWNCPSAQFTALATPTAAPANQLSVALQTAAGSGATFGAGGNGTSGIVSWTTGTSGVTSGAQLIVTFPTTYANIPVVICTGDGRPTAALGPACAAASGSSFTVTVNSTPANGTFYAIQFLVIPQ